MKPRRLRVAVVGAGGNIGRAVVDALRELHEVIALSRGSMYRQWKAQ